MIPLDREHSQGWQIRLVRRNYVLAITVLAALAVANFVSLHHTVSAQLLHAELAMLGADYSQLYTRMRSGAESIHANAGRQEVTNGQFEMLRDRLRTSIDQFRRTDVRMVELLVRDAKSVWPVVPAEVRAAFLDKPFDLRNTLKEIADAAEWHVFLSRDEIAEQNWILSPIEGSLMIGPSLLRGFEVAVTEINASAKRHAARLEAVHVGLTALTLLTLLGELLIVFGPMMRQLAAADRTAATALEELDKIAYTDSLTGVANRAKFRSVLETATAGARQGRPFSVVLCDLDRFKAVNDGFGHHVGDLLLVEMAKRIQGVVRSSDVVARLGGDEFAILVPGLADPDQLSDLLGRIRAATSVPWLHDRVEIDVSSSVGGASSPLDTDQPDRVMAYADKALYTAKEHAPHYKVFDESLRRSSDEEFLLLRELGRAFSENELEVHYQPKVVTETGRCIGFEALVRWRHPEHGLLMPSVFIGAMYRGGRAVDLTRRVLDIAARDAADLAMAGLLAGPIAVNMPEAHLAGNLGEADIRSALEKHGLGSAALAIEITEDVLLSRAADAVQEEVRNIADLGIRVAFDDFGTGFASLTHLRKFSFDELKIDRSFVMEIGRSVMSEQIVRSIASLAHSLSKDVVAEGVETEEQRKFLVELGCRFAQGYLFAKPMPFEALLAWLARQNAAGLNDFVQDKRDSPVRRRAS